MYSCAYVPRDRGRAFVLDGTVTTTEEEGGGNSEVCCTRIIPRVMVDGQRPQNVRTDGERRRLPPPRRLRFGLNLNTYEVVLMHARATTSFMYTYCSIASYILRPA